MNSRLLRKIEQTNTIADIDAAAYDIAFEFRASAHALIDATQLGTDEAEQSAENLVLVSNRMPPETRRLLIDNQSWGFCEEHASSSGCPLVHIWNERNQQWRPLNTPFDAIADKVRDDGTTDTVGVFVFSGQDRVVGLVLQDVPFGRNLRAFDAFKSVANNLITRFLALGSEIKPVTLSQSELNCLTWCASGKTSSEIGTILSLSEHTVNHYFTLICIKLNASNRTHAVTKAIKMGLLDLDDIV